MNCNAFVAQSSADPKVTLELGWPFRAVHLEHKEVRRGGQIFMTNNPFLPTGISHWRWEGAPWMRRLSLTEGNSCRRTQQRASNTNTSSWGMSHPSGRGRREASQHPLRPPGPGLPLGYTPTTPLASASPPHPHHSGKFFIVPFSFICKFNTLSKY